MMKRRMLWCVASVVSAMVLWTATADSQDQNASPQPDPAAPGQPPAAADAESQVDTFVRHAMPGEHHRLLGKLAGSWNMAVKYRMSADSPVVESQGSCQRKWILGKRFVLEEFDGGSLALPFQGLAIYGYDAFEKKYTSVWVDTTNTAMTTSAGTCQEDCKVIAFVGRHGDPWSGTKKPSRGVTRFVSDDKHVLELYEPGREGKEFKVLEIRYTRKSAE